VNKATDGPPKTFISYSWTTPEHQEWVLHFASALRTNGVEAILDKWHLTEGQDTLAFMEQMVGDPQVEKVLLICDARYAEKANKREGGVGIEAQIVSSKVYEESDQTKFAAVVVELDADGRPMLPTYMSSRLYFDMSTPDAYADNFPRIVRWIFGKPFHAVPPVGPPPAFLDETHTVAANVILEGQRLRQSRQSNNQRTSEAAAVLEAAIETAGEMNLSLVNSKTQDEDVYQEIKKIAPINEEVYRAFRALAQSDDPRRVDTAHKYFESLYSLWDKAPETGSHTRWDNDALRFFGHDGLVSFVAACMQEREFEFAAEVLSMPFFKPRRLEKTGDAKSYTDFRPYLQSMEARNERLKLNRRSLHADLLSEAHANSALPFDAFLEADMTLFLRGVLDENLEWYPVSSLYLWDSYGALPNFARATSRRFYDRLKPLLLGTDPDRLKSVIVAAEKEHKFLRSGFRDISIVQLFNAENIGTAP
jgi:hypothetical protein